jgi:hypothetical protein
VFPTGRVPIGVLPVAPGTASGFEIGVLATGVLNVGLTAAVGATGCIVTGAVLTAGTAGTTAGAGLAIGVTEVVGFGMTIGVFSAASSPALNTPPSTQTEANTRLFMFLSPWLVERPAAPLACAAAPPESKAIKAPKIKAGSPRPFHGVGQT